MNTDNLILGIGAGVIILLIALIALWIWMMVYATRKKGLVGFLLVFFLGIIGWIVVLFLPADDKQERERELSLWNLLCQISGWYVRRGNNFRR